MTTINHHIIDRGDGAAVELFQAHPIGSGEPAGAILFVHGNQGGQLTGARELVNRGTLSTFAVAMNVTAAAVSQPGFGASDGPCDFCGPNTQDAIIAALNALKNQPSIDPGRIVLYGHSRGAVAAGMVAARYDGLRAVILSSGVYDLNAFHMDCADGLRIAIETEAGQVSSSVPCPFSSCFMPTKSPLKLCCCMAAMMIGLLLNKPKHSRSRLKTQAGRWHWKFSSAATGCPRKPLRTLSSLFSRKFFPLTR
jgi:pimeloyl-ACP methyl ester carboxylesterase